MSCESLQGPDSAHWFGTDELGRDIFTRVLYGARITIPAGILVIVIGCTLGMVVGAVSGYAGGAWDELIMRIAELFMAFPTIILALAITAALGPDLHNAVIALVIVWWPGYARLIRGLVMEVKTREFVEGARSVGASSVYILFRTVLPNCISSALVLATLDIGNAILSIAGLSFLGLGPDPTSPEWGRMVSTGIDYFDQWWMWLYPGLAIAFGGAGLQFYRRRAARCARSAHEALRSIRRVNQRPGRETIRDQHVDPFAAQRALYRRVLAQAARHPDSALDPFELV